MIQQQRLERARERSRSMGRSNNSSYMLPRKLPRGWDASPDAHEETFYPKVNERSNQIIEEKRSSIERYGEKPTRYIRPVDFVIYDPQRNKDFLERQEESA